MLKVINGVEFDLVLAFLLEKRQDAITSLVYAKCTEQDSARLRGIIQGLDVAITLRTELKKEKTEFGPTEGGY